MARGPAARAVLASELIRRSLRLINVPGRGGTLSGQDTADALEALQDLLASQAVARKLVPGIRTHFFALTAGQADYTYGPGAELDTDDFNDPAPIKIEGVYVRQGGLITENEQVNEPEFVAVGDWVADAGWTIANGRARIGTGDAGDTLAQTLALAPGRTYRVVVKITHRGGDVLLELEQDATPILTETLAGSGRYEFEVGFAGSASEIVFTAAADSDLDVDSVSILADGLDAVSLATDGTDSRVRIIDQATYNRHHNKSASGMPARLLYVRNYPLALVRLNHGASGGQILVMDVLCDRVSVADVSSELRLHPNERRWLRYALANELAGEYGKALRPDQRRILQEAWDLLAAAGARKNKLRVDRALQSRQRFDINRGD